MYDLIRFLLISIEKNDSKKVEVQSIVDNFWNIFSLEHPQGAAHLKDIGV